LFRFLKKIIHKFEDERQGEEVQGNEIRMSIRGDGHAYIANIKSF
jgi:hypothetical protein